MPSQISYNDFFDFRDDGHIKKVLKDLKAMTKAFKDFRSEVTGNYSALYTKQLQEIANQIKKVAAESAKQNITNEKGQRILLQQLQAIQKLKEENERLRQTKKGVEQAERAVADSVNGLTAKLKQQIAAYNELSRSQDLLKRRELAGEIRRTKDEINAMTSALKNSTTATKNARGSYNELDAQTRKLRADMYAMAGGLNFAGKEFDKLKAKIKENEEKLKAFDASVGKNFRNVGNYTSAFAKGFGRVAGTLGILVGIQSVQQLGSQLFNINKNLDALDFTLKNVSKTEIEYARNQQFLKRAARDYGVEIQSLTDGYARFYAAGTSANLSAQTTRTIFDQVAHTAGILHLSQQDVNGVLLAFSQIASKGKVQAEELRGQIGERIPGAFAIAARAIGVTQAQLNEMLRKGQVMSQDFLPKFAAELEKTFAGNAPKHIESLQASVNRFSNELTELARSEELTTFFTRVTDIGTEVIKFFNDLSVGTDELIAEYQSFNEETEVLTQGLTDMIGTYETLKGQTTLNKEEQALLNKTIQDVAIIVPGAVTAWDQYGRALDINKSKVGEFIIAQNNLVRASRENAKAQLQTELTSSLKQLERINADIARGKTTRFSQSGKAYDVSLVDPTTQGATEEGQALLDSQKRYVAELARIDQQAASLGLALPQKAQTFLKAFKDVEYEKTQIIRGLTREVDNYNKEISRNQIEIMNAKTKGEVKAAQDMIRGLVKLRDEAKRKLGDFTDPYAAQAAAAAGDVPTGDGKKGADEAAKRAAKAQRELEKLIRSRQKQLEAAAELEIAIQEDKAVRGIISEQDFQQKKLDIIRDFTSKAIAEEKRLGVNADPSKIDSYNERRQKAETDFTQFLKKQYEDRTKFSKEALAEAFKTVQDDKEKQIKAEEERAEKFQEIQERLLKSRLDSLRASFELEEALRGKNWQREVNYLQEIIRIKKKAGEDTSEEQHRIAMMDAERQKEIHDGWVELAWEAAEVSLEIAQDQFDAIYEKRIAQLEKQRDYELGMAGNNAAAKRAIETKFDKQIAEQKTKQAKADKVFSLFNIGLNTAQGISKTIAQWGMPAAWPFIGMVAAQGILQAALVASRPIPKYWKGRGKGKDEFASINEKGFELIEREGQYRVEAGGKETITHLSSKDVVHTHERSKVILNEIIDRHHTNKYVDSLLEGTSIVRSIESHRDDKFFATMARIMGREDIAEAFDSSVKKIPVHVTNISERGVTQYTIRQQNRIRHMNSRNKFGGDG